MLHFESIEDFHAAVQGYLAKNLSVHVNTKTCTGDMGYGDYQDYKTHTIEVCLDGVQVCYTTFDT